MPSQDPGGFFFAGAGILPGFLLYADDPGLAAMALVALLCAGCVCALADPEAPFRNPSPGDDRGGEGR